jgi:accessory gene regulator B
VGQVQYFCNGVINMKYLFNFKYVKLSSYLCARWLQVMREESHKYRSGYYYGFQILFGAINKLILLVGLSLLFGIFNTTMMAMLSFVVLRVFAGGLHFKSYTLCAYFSISSMILLGVLAQQIVFNNYITNMIFGLIFVMFLLNAPVENFNKPFKNNEKTKYKIFTLFVASILFLIQYIISITWIKISILLGVILAAIITLPFLKFKRYVSKVLG